MGQSARIKAQCDYPVIKPPPSVPIQRRGFLLLMPQTRGGVCIVAIPLDSRGVDRSHTWHAVTTGIII